VAGLEILKHLVSEDWFCGDERGKIYVRYYSMPFAPDEDFLVPGLDGGEVVYSGVRFRVVAARISDQKYTSHVPWLIHADGGNHRVFVEVMDRVLPDADYILISTPMSAGAEDAYNEAALAVDGFAATLRLIGGNNLLREFVREAEVEVSSGEMKTPTKEVPVVGAMEGPLREWWKVGGS
jgi:hypothetical protein